MGKKSCCTGCMSIGRISFGPFICTMPFARVSSRSQMVSGDVPKAVLHGPQVCIWSILPIEVYVLELIRFVFMKFRWRDERARLTWMNHAMVAAAGSGKLDLLHAVDSFRIEFFRFNRFHFTTFKYDRSCCSERPLGYGAVAS